MKNFLYKISLRKLKIILRFFRSIRKNLSGPVLAIAAFVSIIGIFFIFTVVLKNIRSYVEREIEKILILKLDNPGKIGGSDKADKKINIVSDPLTLSSFSDLFSGVGWLDVARTTMYQDFSESAMVFPPKFEWRKTGEEPATFKEKSSGLRGKVLKVGDAYRGLIYKADGTAVLDEASTPIISRYEGTIGLNGEENNFLAVYGAYEGKAVQVKNGQVYDVSKFFPIREMAGGFEPEILRTDANGQTVWYVWSKNGSPARLIKLFENETGKIQGAVDLTPLIFGEGEIPQKLFFDRAVGGVTLAGKMVNNDGTIQFAEFTDRGFDKTVSRTVVSSNLNNYDAKVRKAKIAELDAAGGGGTIKLFLSNDGKTWLVAGVGEEVEFPDPAGRVLLWKAVIFPAGSSYDSVFIDRVNIQFKVSFNF